MRTGSAERAGLGAAACPAAARAAWERRQRRLARAFGWAGPFPAILLYLRRGSSHRNASSALSSGSSVLQGGTSAPFLLSG